MIRFEWHKVLMLNSASIFIMPRLMHFVVHESQQINLFEFGISEVKSSI